MAQVLAVASPSLPVGLAVVGHDHQAWLGSERLALVPLVA